MSFLFGGDTPKVEFNPVGAKAGGLTTSVPSNGGYITVTSDADRKAAVSGVADTYTALADRTAGLSGLVTPGYNNLLTSQLGSIDNAATAAVGNLRQNLQSRRVLGSSFGQDTLTRANAEFQKQRNDTIAQNYLQSIDATNKLLQQEYAARSAAAQTGLSELNFEADKANALIGSTNDILAKNAQVNAKLEADSQAGMGKFFGNIFQQVAGPTLGKAGTGIADGLGKLATSAFALI